MDGRRFRSMLPLISKPENGVFGLHLPRPGIVRGVPALGTTLAEGAIAGELDVLGVLHALTVPKGVSGAITRLGGDAKRAKASLGAGDRLMVLDPTALSAGANQGAIARASSKTDGLFFRAPLGGRYYAKPSPLERAFVIEGEELEIGQTIALLEVMKTFNRVRYAAENGLPERVQVLRLIPKDGDDILAGDPILELKAL